MEREKKRTPACTEGSAIDENPTDLKSLIHEHSLFFDQLVELIPARFFVPYSGDDKPWFPGLSKSEKNKLKAQTRDNIVKSRRDRLDPTQFSSTLDLLKKSLAEDKETSDEESEDGNDVDDEDEEEEQEVGEVEKMQNKVAVTGEQPVTYEELQERLRRRIAELAAGRNTRPESRLKQEKKKGMKNKKKLKVETKKNKEKNKDKDKDAAASTSNSSGKRKREDGNDGTLLKNKKKNKVVEPTDITFGQVRIDGKDSKKRKKKLPKEKELERAKRLEEVKKDPEKGKKVSWKAAVSKAAGEKVHDDPKLLKQSIKREKKRQQKNAKTWKERELTVAKAKADKQSKRSENINERIHQKKMRKIEKREKKLMRPGFEGRKEGYINE